MMVVVRLKHVEHATGLTMEPCAIPWSSLVNYWLYFVDGIVRITPEACDLLAYTLVPNGLDFPRDWVAGKEIASRVGIVGWKEEVTSIKKYRLI